MLGNRSKGLYAAVVVLLAQNLFVLCPEAVAQTPSPNGRISRLIRELDDNDFFVRERAEQELIKIGRPAYGAVLTATADPSLELRTRAKRILGRIPYAPDVNAKLGPVITAKNASQVEQIGLIDRNVWKVAWRPDGRQVALVGWEMPVQILDARTFNIVNVISADKRAIHFAFSVNPALVAYCENSKRVEILNFKFGQLIQLNTLNIQPRMVFSPDGRLLATGGGGNRVQLWNPSDGSLIREFSVSSKEGGLVPVFSPDGKILAIGNRNSTTRLFKTATGEPLHTLGKELTHELAFDPAGKRLAVAYVDGSIGIWDVTSGKRLQTGESGAQEIYTLDWSPNGELIAAAGLKGPITIWDAKDLSLLYKMPAEVWVGSVRFSPDGRRFLTVEGTRTSEARRVKVWGTSFANK